MIQNLIKKKMVVPVGNYTGNGDSHQLAGQLDIALISVGFKMSHELLTYVGGLEFIDALDVSHKVLKSVKTIVGDHVKHNTYFIDFPNNVPNNESFWFEQIIKAFIFGINKYGSYQHTYEEMLARHESLSLEDAKLKVLKLGKTESEELQNLYRETVSSKIPLNEDDRTLLSDLLPEYFVPCDIPVRENKAIVNAWRIQNGQDIIADTPLDILRVCVQLSGGDVTLLEKTKFKSFKRSVRRSIMRSLDEMISAQPIKIEDISNYKERFKRLAEAIHPYEFSKQYVHAIKLFGYANGDSPLKTTTHQNNTYIQNKDFRLAIASLGKTPGKLFRTIDKISRECSDRDFNYLNKEVGLKVDRVSSRVLLSLWEHLNNRNNADKRIFVNKSGKGYVVDNEIPQIDDQRIIKLTDTIKKDLSRRISYLHKCYVDNRLLNARIAVPLSEKTKSSGFQVLPRGSILPLDHTKDVLRFFMYWKQTSERTDYDLSCVFYDKDFQMISQLSWTQINGEFGCHSGDIISAPNGASEFIELNLPKIDRKVRYILPTINVFTGESFEDVSESFFGWMSRDKVDKGAPFEAKTVQTKFEMRGKGKIACPVVFFRDGNGFSAKWTDLYMNGMISGNMVEKNKYSSGLIANTIIDRKYLTINDLINLYAEKSKEMIYVDSSQDVILGESDKYIGMDNLKDILP